MNLWQRAIHTEAKVLQTAPLLVVCAVFGVVGASLLASGSAESNVLSQSVTASGTGSYALSLTMHSDASPARVVLTLAGQRLGQWTIGTTDQTYQVPVYTQTGEQITVTSIKTATPAQPITVSALSLSASSAQMTVKGTRIIDSKGQTFIPRGVNHNSLEASPTGWYWGAYTNTMIYNWGSTMVRIPMGEQFWVPGMCDYSTANIAAIDDAVNRTTYRGMVALLDLHFTTKGQTVCGTGKPQKSADKFSPQFWSIVAARYKNNPLVAFELINEPHDISETIWLNGGTVDGYQATGMQALYDAIRGTGAQNLILVDGNNWASDLRPALTLPVNGYNLVYAPHAYYCLPPKTYNCDSSTVTSMANTLVKPIAASYPVVFTEFGGPAHSGEGVIPKYSQAVIDYANARQEGWLAWTWEVPGAKPYDWGFLANWNPMDPNDLGLVIRNALWAARGWNRLGGTNPAPLPPPPPPQTVPPNSGGHSDGVGNSIPNLGKPFSTKTGSSISSSTTPSTPPATSSSPTTTLPVTETDKTSTKPATSSSKKAAHNLFFNSTAAKVGGGISALSLMLLGIGYIMVREHLLWRYRRKATQGALTAPSPTVIKPEKPDKD